LYENSSTNYSFEFIICDSGRNPIIFSPQGFTSKQRFTSIQGKNRSFVFDIELPTLANGNYFIDAMIVNPGIEFFHFEENIGVFQIDDSFVPETGWNFNQDRNQGVILSKPQLRSEAYLK
jgi:hypothetical protein